MSYKLIISSNDKENLFAILDNDILIELFREKNTKQRQFLVGDIYLGKVRRLNNGVNAAFVNVGSEKDGFLHYSDLGPNLNTYKHSVKQAISNNVSKNINLKPQIDKSGRIKDVISINEELLCKITKEPIASKGPKLSTEITLAGRYMVLLPNSDKISISSRIKNPKEKDRLRILLESILPKNYGCIVRTAASVKKVADIHNDLSELINQWETILKNLKNKKSPSLIHSEINKSSSILRDTFHYNFDEIIVEDDEMLADVKNYLNKYQKEKLNILKKHTSKIEIFQHYGIQKQIKASFGKKVLLKNGGYLIIEQTEALHVIDVNSGNIRVKENDYENHNININKVAAKEIARLLKLRDLGGIICIDYIDMSQDSHRKELFHYMKDEMELDKAKHNLAPISKFGIMEITRQRLKPETEFDTTEKCPACGGQGVVQSTLLITDLIKTTIEQLDKSSGMELIVHPFIESYLKKSFYSRQFEWLMKYRIWIKITGQTSRDLLHFKIINRKKDILFDNRN